MDPVRNPFAPGAGSQPPALAGRDHIIAAAEIALQRILQGRADKSQILLGLRGTGKTVLLNKIEQLAEKFHHVTSFIEAPEDRPLPQLLYPKIHSVLSRLSVVAKSRSATISALRALRSFAGTFKIEFGDVSLSVDPERGIADSGNIEFDLSDIFQRVGVAAKDSGLAWTLLIDELQYLKSDELAALIVGMHRVSQKQLPIIFFGAGLPQIAALSGNAKSYAERLFDFPQIGQLDQTAAIAAIRQPIHEEGESIEDNALLLLLAKAQGYPYFLQEWGYQTWNTAEKSPITSAVVETASRQALRRLDEGFFRVRFDRLTPKEREYVMTMARLGKGPYRSSDVAEALGEPIQALGPRRAKIIKKGMIYSRAHGDIDFTVPMFDDFLKRLAQSEER
ncbi:ATP-binding protein [Candidatus Raskinella chloraquaticus]|uniref:AAA family ATPase n=1 Tax=Candidatus Raskinella chloraquaticus TaxID=1951219 RepID=A0A1W9I3G4_9HYPH|nr:MAG: AAA family ATPase [Proteobacteria bacterium SG_bin8]